MLQGIGCHGTSGKQAGNTWDRTRSPDASALALCDSSLGTVNLRLGHVAFETFLAIDALRSVGYVRSRSSAGWTVCHPQLTTNAQTCSTTTLWVPSLRLKSLLVHHRELRQPAKLYHDRREAQHSQHYLTGLACLVIECLDTVHHHTLSAVRIDNPSGAPCLPLGGRFHLTHALVRVRVRLSA